MSGLLSSLTLSSAVVSSIISGATPPEPPTINPETLEVITTKQAGDSETSVLRQKINDILLKEKNTTETIVSSQGTLTGIDMSSHQHKHLFDLSAIYDQSLGGQDFAFVKATEGTHYVNPYFREDVITLINQNIPLGFYHYAKPSTDIEDARVQARLFIQVTGMAQGVKGFDPVLDIEESGGVENSALIEWISAYVDEIKKLTGRDTIIYTYPNFWRDNVGNTTQFSHLPLWIADYNNKATPNALPGGWTDWVFWQYTDRETVEGSEKPVDGNIFNGTVEELKELYQ